MAMVDKTLTLTLTEAEGAMLWDVLAHGQMKGYPIQMASYLTLGGSIIRKIDDAAKKAGLEINDTKWMRDVHGGTATFKSEPLGNPVQAYQHEVTFQKGNTMVASSRQTTGRLSKADVEKLFEDFISTNAR
jgi:hypothetical protein